MTNRATTPFLFCVSIYIYRYENRLFFYRKFKAESCLLSPLIESKVHRGVNIIEKYFIRVYKGPKRKGIRIKKAAG
jgi:hypothetical protein